MADSTLCGVIAIPSRIINDIIVQSSIPGSKKTMDNTVALIAQAFSGKVMDLSGDTVPCRESWYFLFRSSYPDTRF